MVYTQIKNLLFKTLNSTQTYAKTHYKDFDPQVITCVSADLQTKGKARFEKKWSSPQGNIFSTYYFRLPQNIPNLSSLTLLMAVSIIKTLLAHSLPVMLKWPNDIFIQGSKVAGILCETFLENRYYHLFLGTGININMEKKELQEIEQKATSLYQATNQIWDKNQILIELQEHFLQDLQTFCQKGLLAFLPLIQDHLLFKNQKVLLEIDQKQYTGIVDSIQPDGALVLSNQKKKQSFYSGSIRPL